jgi:hypothetical protein
MVGALYKPKSIGFGYLQIKFILDLPAAYGFDFVRNIASPCHEAVIQEEGLYKVPIFSL